MNQFIIATHATLAGGFADVVNFFKSDLRNVQYINAYAESPEFEKEFRTCLETVKENNVIVLTDIMGGSVNQVATRLMPEYQYQLITGINLALLLALVFIPDDITAETIEALIQQAREQMVYMNSFTPEDEGETL